MSESNNIERVSRSEKLGFQMNKFDNFSKWFDDVLFKGGILDNRYPVKGFAVYMGWGTRIMNKVTGILEERLEATEHDPTLFPVAISEDAFAKEAEHIEGFTAEVFWITHAGKRKLKKKLLLRPTSETAMYPMFAYWIRSHADLPLRIYQSVSVYRYETKATRPLLRVREIPWNEAHTAHEDWNGAEEQVETAVQVYSTVFNQLGLAYYKLRRPDFDKFAGSVYSIAFDAWNPDGRVNQIGTVHNLGENFAKAFNLTYEDSEGNHKKIVQTCYGFGISRTLAAIITQHGDIHGMVLPPEIAPVQVVVIPIIYKGYEIMVENYAKEVYETIKKKGFRVQLDLENKNPGEKYYYWEMRGVPTRVEVGPKDHKERNVTISERFKLTRKTVAFEDMLSALDESLKILINKLMKQSQATLKAMTVNSNNLESIKGIMTDKKIARICWCENIRCAETVKEVSGGEIRGHRIDLIETPQASCIVCGGKALKVVYVARAY